MATEEIRTKPLKTEGFSDSFPNTNKNCKNSTDTELEPIRNMCLNQEFSRYERLAANNLGYFAITLTRFERNCEGKYSLKSTSIIAQLLFWGCYLNTFLKSIFLCFLVTDYFGPVVFLDKIAALDYILCVGIAVCGTLVWGLRYPLHEIIYNFWSLESRIFQNLGCPSNLKENVKRVHRNTVWIHLAIVWIGCGCLAIQFYADPKYCAYTYSIIDWDTWWLRLIFCLHEFFFMMNPWNVNTSSSAICTFEGVSISKLMEKMTVVVKANPKAIEIDSNLRLAEKPLLEQAYDLKTRRYSVEQLIDDYKQISMITEQFNDWVAYKVLAIHVCSYCQFISDVFVAIQVLRGGGGFMDVWFYLEDCLAGILMIHRVYTFMSRVAKESKEFLRALEERIQRCRPDKKLVYRKIFKTLKVVSLRLGPIVVTPMTVLDAMNTFGTYYVCVALWK